MSASRLHPLSPIQGDEITTARQVVLDSGKTEVSDDDLRFAYVGLCDPLKEKVHAFDRGESIVVDRRLRLVLLQGPEADVTEVIVSVTRRAIDSWLTVTDVRPPLQMEEAILVLHAL
jgi:Cu2+-containing amine oxidase